MSQFLSRLVRFGRLRVEFADGTVRDFGDGTGPPVAISSPIAARSGSLLRRSELKLGELYMDGRLHVTQGDLYDLLAIGAANLWKGEGSGLDHGDGVGARPRQASGRPATTGAARATTSPRITISTTGSTICFSTPTGNIPAPISSTRTRRSTRRSSPRSATSPPSCWSTTAIACSTSAADSAAWGSISRSHTGARVTGVTLSAGAAGDRAAARAGRRAGDARRFPTAGLSRRRGAVRPHRLGRHVRARRVAALRRIFRHVSRLLNDDGVMLLHAIGRSTGPGYTNPWIEKYIFPGGYIPAVSEVLAAIEKFGPIRHRRRRSCDCTTPTR